MNFENIKVGDEVLVPKHISYGWKNGKTFYITDYVTRVTKTQFCCGDIRAKKENGNIIGDSWSRIHKVGDISRFGKEILKDQTLEMNSFKKKVNIYTKIKNWDINLRNINVETTELSKLNKLSSLIDEIDNLIKGI